VAVFNPFRASYQEEPYASLAQLRRTDPIARSREPDGWIVTRHEDARNVLRDDECYSNDPGRATGGMGAHVAASRRRSPIGETPLIGSSDPPVHTRLRGIVSRLFTARAVSEARLRIRELVHELLDAAAPSGQLELMSQLARPLPSYVVAELLGLNAEERAPVRHWTRAVMRAASGGELPPSAYREADEAIASLRTFLDRYPDSHEDEGTILGELVAAEQQEDRLSPMEAVAFLGFLDQAGGGPTSMMLANAVLSLLAHREQWELLRTRPELTRQAVVETLRWDSATQFLIRIAIEGHQLGRRRVRAGETIYVGVGAAHRDPDMFDEPDRFDITRATDTADILSFGVGPHFCLGQPLALIQAEELLGALAERYPDLAVAPDGMVRQPDLLLRGPQRLELQTS